MITTDAIRNLLAIADVTKNPYTVATVAASLLAANQTDPVALGHYVRALTALKLMAAAKRVVSAAKVAGVDLGDLGGSVGLVPWLSRARRFAANVKVLEARTPEGAAAVRKAAEELARYELHQAADGNFQVLDLQGGVTNAWLGGLADHKGATAMWQFDRAQTPVPPPIAFDGLGFGWLWLRVLETTAHSYLNYSCAVYVLESDPLALAMLLHMHDLQEVIGQERMRWFIHGTDPTDQADGDVLTTFRRAIETHGNWSIPGRFVRCALRPRSELGLQEAIQELQQLRQDQREQKMAEVRRYYAGKTAIRWHRRFSEALTEGGTAKPLRVLGITSRFTTVLQHSMSELKSAIEAGGNCAMRIAMEADDQSFENPFLEEIAAFKPDLILQISRMRYENPAVPKEVPFLCWDQDNLPCMRTEQATASLVEKGTGPLTYVAGNAAIFGFGHLNWPEKNCIFCHSAGATHRYSAEPVSAELLAKYACDISYVSNASGSPESLALQLRFHWEKNAACLHFFDSATREILAASLAGKCWDDLSLSALMDSGGGDGGGAAGGGIGGSGGEHRSRKNRRPTTK